MLHSIHPAPDKDLFQQGFFSGGITVTAQFKADELILEPVISPKLLKKIELGPRQLTFGFDNRTTDSMDCVFSFIEKKYQTGGPVNLDEVISSSRLLEEFSAQEILQAMFWLAEELKVHFFVEELISSPRQIKQMLTTTPACPVFVVTNKPVDKHTFEQAIKTCRAISDRLPEEPDQYTFSRMLISEFKTWHKKIASYASLAEQPFFPGRKEIKSCMVLLDKILKNQDSHSVILSCVKYQSRIGKLSETINVLTQFYDQKLAFWRRFIDQMQAFEANSAEIRKNKAIFEKYRRLSEIMKSSFPFPMVVEAENLLGDVQDLHEEIEHKKILAIRSNALAKTDKMIQKLINLFDTFESDKEYRNNCLHEIRILSKKIEASRQIEEINILLNDAKDLFVDIIEEV